LTEPEYIIYADDVIEPRLLEYTKVLYFHGDEESDVFISAGVWLAENDDKYATIIGMDITYYDEEPGVSLTLVVDGVAG
jgi:hypothetical protein